MATFSEVLSDFFADNGDVLKFFLIWFFLFIALMHAFSYAVTYILTLLNVVRRGEKSQEHQWKTRAVALGFLTFYLIYNTIVYSLLLQIINWRQPFYGEPWTRSILSDNSYGWLLRIEPAILILTTWFKISCAVDAWHRSPSSKEIKRVLDEAKKQDTLPNITIVMPIYNEPIETLMTAINSVTTSAYPLSKLHLVMAFDDDGVTPLYRAVIYCLTSGNPSPDWDKLSSAEGLDELGVSNDANEYPHIGDVMYRGLKVTPCRFVHGGKRHAQMCAFRYLSGMYQHLPRKPLLLFIDSDIELHEFAIPHFVHDLNRHKNIEREALTGLITCKTAGTYSFWAVLQDTEYIESQMLQRNSEDYLGSVSCLPGALTMVRFEVLERVAGVYFDSMDASDTYDFNRTHLGEDRYLTHLIMESRPEKYRIGFCPGARCKTEACDNFRSLMKQRRRWYLGTVLNEVYMLTSPTLWKQLPGLNTLVALSALKNGPLFVYVFLVEVILGRGSGLSLAFAGLIFLPIWLFVMSFGIRIKRTKIAWFYPILLVVMPILASIFQVYGMMTFRVRTWGGPRAQAAEEDEELDQASVDVLDDELDKQNQQHELRSNRNSRALRSMSSVPVPPA